MNTVQKVLKEGKSRTGRIFSIENIIPYTYYKEIHPKPNKKLKAVTDEGATLVEKK
jgi:hypothetical protein